MSILRVVLEDAPLAARADAWSLFDAQGHRLQSGHGVPASWPDASRREAVLAASRVRVSTLTLPPMPADRIASAAAFALEDAFARPASEHAMHASARDAQGRVVVTVTERALVETLARDFARVIAEPALAPVPAPAHWLWLPSAARDSFIRQPDGSAFVVSHPRDGIALPAELALALRHRGAGVAPPSVVEVAFAVTDAQLDAWSMATRVPFRCTDPWRWDRDGTLFDALPDLGPRTGGDAASRAQSAAARTMRGAGVIAGVALLGAVLATIVHWSWLRLDGWRTTRAIVATATEAGVTDAGDADAAAAGLTRRWSDARHGAALAVPGDALPLLARVAPALGALRKGALKSATFGPGQWTFDLATMDPAALASFEAQLANAGLRVLAATNASGTRLRATLAPGLERP